MGILDEYNYTRLRVGKSSYYVISEIYGNPSIVKDVISKYGLKKITVTYHDLDNNLQCTRCDSIESGFSQSKAFSTTSPDRTSHVEVVFKGGLFGTNAVVAVYVNGELISL